jgi:hypothetical protein
VTLEIPKGTAALRGKVANPASEFGPAQLRSKDNRLFAYAECKADGGFEINELPAGEYVLEGQMFAKAQPLATLSLVAGEHKSISLATLTPPALRGLLRVRPFTSDGRPLPGCKVELSGTRGPVTPRPITWGQVSFVTEPGFYQLSVSYPGYVPVTKQVEVKAIKSTYVSSENDSNVTLVRSTGSTNAEIR